MVLAAGRATRMEPLSTVVAKPALEVLGRPLVSGAVAALRRAGCRRLVVNLHRHPALVAAAARSCDAGIAFSWEPELLGGAGGLAAARGLLGEGGVLAANADVWTDLDPTPLYRAGEAGTITLALLPHPDPARWGSVLLDRQGRVRDLVAAGASATGERYLFTGFQLLGAEATASLPEPPVEMRTAWETVRHRGALRGVVVAGSWREVGTPSAYLSLVTELLGEGSWVHPQAEVAADARVVRGAVGAGCRVGPGALVEESVLTAGAALAKGARLRRCVAAGPVTVTGARSDAVILPEGVSPLL